MTTVNLSFCTYTHSNCKDVWNPYFARLEKHAEGIKNYMLNNTSEPSSENHNFIQYDDNKNYAQEFVRCLEEVKTDYIIYMQEDFILYSDVQKDLLQEYIDVLENDKSISYIRLIRCGDVTTTSYQENRTLYYICDPGVQNNSINSFSMQPTIWRKEDFIKLYTLTNAEKFGESWEYTQAMNKLNINGLYSYQGENKRGANHYDSSVFPYIATAIVKGKWNFSEYTSELVHLFNEFKIDYKKRGCR
jgi:hypothetical protein